MSGQRVHERHEIELPVTIVHEGQEQSGTTVNIGLGGAFITTAQELPFGSQVHLKLRLPAIEEEVSIPATVRWARPDGLGVQFGAVRALEVWAFNQLFKVR